MLCSSEKRNGVQCIRGPPKHLSSLPRGYHCDVVEQQANFLLHYENVCSYKGHYIAYAIPKFRKGLT